MLCKSTVKDMADSLAKLFFHIKQKPDYYLKSAKGKDFEDRINEGLNKHGYSPLMSDGDDIDKKSLMIIKEKCQKFDSMESIENLDSHKKHFIKQPCGPQDYPDFWVFCEKSIFSIEVKFSQQKTKKPVWNSGLPRPNGIYIFGSYGMKQITFFRGIDVVGIEEIKKMHCFFEDLKRQANKFNKSELKNQKYGFAVYSRKAYDQKKIDNEDAIIDYFTNPDREKLEQNVINYVSQ